MPYQQILEQLKSHPPKLVALGCIVNPYGPTIASLLLLHESNDWALYRLILNPFHQELTRLRAAKEEESASPNKIIEEQGLGLTGTPTILLFASARSDDEIFAGARQVALAVDDFGSTIDSLRRFPGNPWDRITEEVREAEKKMVEVVKQKKSNPTPPGKTKSKRKPTNHDIDDYLTITLKNFKEELPAFCSAWNGSIELQKSSGNLELAKTAMPFDDMDEAMHILMKARD